jgi:hypothetical protein
LQLVNGTTTAFPITQTATGATLELNGASSQGATQASITIVNAGVTWFVDVVGNGVYVERNGVIVKTLSIVTSKAYSFDLTLHTDANTLGVVINGMKYL